MDPVNGSAKFEIIERVLKNFGQSMDTPFKVIQGRCFWYQSKAHMRLPVSLLVALVLSCTVSEILQLGFLYSWVTPPLFYPNFLGCSCCTRSPIALSYTAVKLFSKYSNLCENHTSTSQTYRQTEDEQTTYCGITALCVASRGKKLNEDRSVLLAALNVWRHLKNWSIIVKGMNKRLRGCFLTHTVKACS